jgi:hypothetical protein
MPFDSNKAIKFIEAVDISGTPRPIVSLDAAVDAGAVFDKAKNQAQVVGADVLSFTVGVESDVRQAISDSALLAQLVANKKSPFDQSPRAWFKAYSGVLQNLGWVVQDAGWNDYSTGGTAAEVNEQIIEVMTVLLGPAPAALSIIKTTVSALKAMKSDSSWITIFSRESQKAKIARFQIGLVEKDKNGGFLVSLLACVIEADNTITQVLFFKFKEANAKFTANSAKISINPKTITDIGPAVRDKVKVYIQGYLSSIKDL